MNVYLWQMHKNISRLQVESIKTKKQFNAIRFKLPDWSVVGSGYDHFKAGYILILQKSCVIDSTTLSVLEDVLKTKINLIKEKS